MRAMVIPEFGSPDLFEERDLEKTQVGPGEVLVRVIATGTNPVDTKFRANGDAMGLEAPIILGADISGVSGVPKSRLRKTGVYHIPSSLATRRVEGSPSARASRSW